jgi:hypothetical protein
MTQISADEDRQLISQSNVIVSTDVIQGRFAFLSTLYASALICAICG